MKIILVNGSPNAKGCTYTALTEISKTLTEEGLESDIFQVGKQPLSGCIACGKCRESGRCIFKDRVNDFLDLAAEADGFIFGSPVHYASAAGALISFMDRAFFAAPKELYRLKAAAAIVSARRGGCTAAFDQINKYFTISEMPVISSHYWNMVHGMQPSEVLQDLEGMQIMRTLARNMAWFLKCKEAGLKAGITLPMQEKRQITNFIR